MLDGRAIAYEKRGDMVNCQLFEQGNYRFIPGVFQYSGGVIADKGFHIERIRFSRLLPLADGFRLASEHLRSEGRPLTAFCACELRSPKPFSEEGFLEFNECYVRELSGLGILSRENANPVARSNVCPEVDAPTEVAFHAFCYTVKGPAAAPSFVISGSAEAPEGKGNYKDHIVRRADVSREGLREKAQWVLAELERRMDTLNVGWTDVTSTQLYTVCNAHPLLGAEIGGRGAMHAGLNWYYCRPPIVELDFEMDCRGIYTEKVLKV